MWPVTIWCEGHCRPERAASTLHGNKRANSKIWLDWHHSEFGTALMMITCYISFVHVCLCIVLFVCVFCYLPEFWALSWFNLQRFQFIQAGLCKCQSVVRSGRLQERIQFEQKALCCGSRPARMTLFHIKQLPHTWPYLKGTTVHEPWNPDLKLTFTVHSDGVWERSKTFQSARGRHLPPPPPLHHFCLNHWVSWEQCFCCPENVIKDLQINCKEA